MPFTCSLGRSILRWWGRHLCCYAVDMCDVFNTDAILLSALLICNIISPLNIINNFILGICCKLGLGVLNGLLGF